MHLKIVTPLKLYQYTINSLDLNILTGNVVIQAGHAPALMVLKPDSFMTWISSDNTMNQMKYNKGIAEIKRQSITIVVDHEKINET